MALRQLAKQTAVYGLSSMVGRLLNYLLVPFYTRIFTNPADYGIVTELYAYATFLMIVFTYGMESAFFRFSSNQENTLSSRKVYSNGLYSLLISSLFMGGAIWLLMPWIAPALGYRNQEIYLQIMLLILVTDAISAMPFARLRQEEKALQYAGLKLINIFLNIGLNLFFLVWWPHYQEGRFFLQEFLNIQSQTDAVLYIFLANLIANGLTALMLLPLWKKPDLDFRILKKMLKYGWPLMIAGLAGMVNETLDRLLLKQLVVSPSESEKLQQLGIYGAVYKLAMLMTLFIQTYRMAAEPYFFKQLNSDQPQLRYASIMNYFSMVLIAIFLVVAIGLEWFGLFIGEPYREGLSVVPILLLANLFLGLYVNLSVWFKLTDKTQYALLFTGLGAGITILGNMILVPRMGYEGAAWATLICYFTMAVSVYWMGQKHYPIPYSTGKIVFWLCAAVGLYWLQEQVLFLALVTYTEWRIGIKLMFLLPFLALMYRSLKPKPVV